MRVAIDAFNIALAHGTGVATYGRTLASAAAGLGHEVNVLFGAGAGHSKVPLLNEIALAEVGAVSARGPSRAALARGIARGLAGARPAHDLPISGQVILPPGLRLDARRHSNVPNLFKAADLGFRAAGAFSKVKVPGTDLAHWTYPLPLKMVGARNVYTLHDLVPLRLPYTTADVKHAYYRLCRRIARDADHILTVSECSRRDIVRLLGVDEDRVTNLYQTSDIADAIAGVSEDFVARYVEGLLGVGMREYFLFFGAIEPKKNVARLIEAFLASAVQSPLVIVGGAGWGGEQDVKLLKSLAGMDTRKRIVWLGYLPRQMLAMLIAGARATVFPSLYEGFGLPVLESMELGTPVITSNVSSLPEVAQDAGLLVDPYDVRSLATAFLQLDADPGLRSQMSMRGREVAAGFSAEAYRGRLADFYAKF